MMFLHPRYMIMFCDYWGWDCIFYGTVIIQLYVIWQAHDINTARDQCTLEIPINGFPPVTKAWTYTEGMEFAQRPLFIDALDSLCE